MKGHNSGAILAGQVCGFLKARAEYQAAKEAYEVARDGLLGTMDLFDLKEAGDLENGMVERQSRSRKTVPLSRAQEVLDPDTLDALVRVTWYEQLVPTRRR